MVKIDSADGIWVLADGRTATTEYFQTTGDNKIPDLRGQFLCGLNSGRADGKEDPEGNDRLTGSYQVDTVKNHNHTNGIFKHLLTYSSLNTVATTNVSVGEPDLVQSDTLKPYGGLETRPKNSAVYWYIKVK
jgi:hypothetical protein